jgi:hypothetical protein
MSINRSASRPAGFASVAALLLLAATTALTAPVHVWEKVEITLLATNTYGNPYTDAQVWVELNGPGFARRCYGFWDGGNTFRVRVLATTPGHWHWRSGSEPADPGLAGHSGAFEAVSWTDTEKQANICRRGNLRATANGHAFELADGTPFFLLGDTWWATPTFRFRWRDDDAPRSVGPDAGFKDFVRFRRQQEFNCIALIAALPNWANDGHPANLTLADGTVLRSAWREAGTDRAKNMTNEFGQRAFLFPGKVPGFETVFPDVERLNPAYFQTLDGKMDYLNAQGFIPFIEVARRDIGQAWKRFWEVIQWPSADQMRHLKSFLLSEGRRYQELEPATNAVSPNRSGKPNGLTGWVYAARTSGRDLFLLYFEQDCPSATLTGARPGGQIGRDGSIRAPASGLTRSAV